MKTIVSDITIRRQGDKVKIIPSYSDATSEGTVDIKKIIIEKYEVPIEADFLKEIRKAIDLQQVLQHVGINTAYSSKLFLSGGANVYKEPYLVDITYGVQKQYPYFIDDASNINNSVYLYRVLSYGLNSYEYGTRYVAGIINDTTFFDSKNPYHNYLDMQDILELLPEGNIEGLRVWVKYMSFFIENYKLRFFGEIEDFKFNTHLSRAFMSIYFLTELVRRIESYLVATEVKLYESST